MWILIFILAVIVIHDTGRYLSTRYRLEQVTKQAAVEAESAARRAGEDTMPGFEAAQAYAEPEDVEVYGYEQAAGEVTIWTQAEVKTFALAPIAAMLSGQQADAPFLVQEKATR
jgi:hypothetical protein